MLHADVCIVSPFGRGKEHGGITPAVAGIASGLSARGMRVDVLCFYPDGAGEAEDWLAGTGATVTVLDAPRRHLARPALRRHVRSTLPGAVLAAGHRFNQITLDAVHSLHRKPRLILSIHNRLSSELASMRFATRLRLKALVRRRYPTADCLVAVSQGVAEDLLCHTALEADRLRVIYNPVIGERFQRLVQAPPPHSWFTDAGPPTMLAAGRLTAQKNFHLLLNAFHKLLRHREARLVIVGEGPERLSLERLIQELAICESVDMPGFIHNPYSMMAASAGFILSSDWEGFGNVLAEAMAAGAPLVATDCPSGPREILEDGRYGLLVPRNDVNALAEAMTCLIDGQVNRPPPSAANRFKISEAAQQYAKLLTV